MPQRIPLDKKTKRNMAPPEKIDLSGTPREIGLAHGRRLADKIKRQIEIYDAMFRQTSKLNWAEVRDVAKVYQTSIQGLTPDIYTEMVGIAEGASLDILDIVALNSRSEIALGMFSDGCTSIGWNRREKGVILAQNWDWVPRIKENLVLMSIRQEGKPTIHFVDEAGLVGKIGFNSSSVGVCFNAIRAKPTDDTKLPVYVGLRLCLESNSKAEAIARLESLCSVASSQHILIADGTGPTCLELSPVGNTYIEPDSDGIVCHTNHFITNRYVNEPPWLKGSAVRLDRASELTKGIATRGGEVSVDVLRREVFSDCFNSPEAICCSWDATKPTATAAETLFNIAMDLSTGRPPSAEVVWGRPGSGEEGSPLKMPW